MAKRVPWRPTGPLKIKGLTTGKPGQSDFETWDLANSAKHNARHGPYYFIGEKSVGRMYVESTFSTVFSVCSDFTTA